MQQSPKVCCQNKVTVCLVRHKLSLGVGVDLETDVDGPQPANEEPAGKELEQTDNDAWDEGVTASEDSSDDGRPTGEEDGEYKDD